MWPVTVTTTQAEMRPLEQLATGADAGVIPLRPWDGDANVRRVVR